MSTSTLSLSGSRAACTVAVGFKHSVFAANIVEKLLAWTLPPTSPSYSPCDRANQQSTHVVPIAHTCSVHGCPGCGLRLGSRVRLVWNWPKLAPSLCCSFGTNSTLKKTHPSDKSDCLRNRQQGTDRFDQKRSQSRWFLCLHLLELLEPF